MHVRVCTCSMCPGRARSGRADRKLRALHAWLLARGRWSHLRVMGWCSWLEEVGDEVDRGVDRLARALVPRRMHADVCAWVLCVRSGVCGGWEERVGLGRRSHLELKRGLHLELDGVGLLVVERRQQGDDEW